MAAFRLSSKQLERTADRFVSAVARFNIGLLCDLCWFLVDEGQEVYRFNLV